MYATQLMLTNEKPTDQRTAEHSTLDDVEE